MPEAAPRPAGAGGEPAASGAASRKLLFEILAAVGNLVASGLALGLAFTSAWPRDPWLIVLGVVPLSALLAWLGAQVARSRRLVLWGRAGAALAVYVTIFMVLAGSNLLNWRQTLIGYGDGVPANWLGLSRTGDWHYWFAERSEPRQDLLVVEMPDDESKFMRHRLASLIAMARDHGALGVALDFYFAGESSPFDGLLCNEIKNRRIPVFAGYRPRVNGDVVIPVLPPASLCLAESQLGHLNLYRESDGRIRMAPLHLAGIRSLESLDCRIAEALGAVRPCARPATLVQFLEPRQHEPPQDGALQRSLEQVNADPELLRHRFLLVGRNSANDLHDTPFGRRLGVMIHASLVQALRDDVVVQRLTWWWTLPTIAGCCAGIAALFAAGAARRKLIVAAMAMSAAVALVALLAMQFSLVWLDISYPLLAIWTLVLVLLVWWPRFHSGLGAGQRRANGS